MTKRWRDWRLFAVCLLLLACLALKGMLIEPPSPPGKPSEREFNTARALARLERILGDQRPHSVDTAANDAVRGRLMAEIAAIGLKPEPHEAIDCSDFPKSRTVSCSRVRNVIAVIPGSDAPALLLNAHYDSTPTGPGAADDGIGVATLLEVAHHLRSEKLARPVILLFNEGEEYGLNGAAAFAESDPLAKSVGKLINIEARGVSGPAFMFETSEPNGPAIASYKAASQRPFANSISTDFAKLIPNSTDVVKFKPRGWELLSYAIIGNETRYHSPGDTTKALSRASLYHMGSEVLAASRQLAGPDAVASDGRRLFMDVGGRLLLTMPMLAGVLLLGGLAVVAAVLVVRRQAWRPVIGLLIAIIVATLASGAAAYLANVIRPGDFWRAYPWISTLAVGATVLAIEAWLIARHADQNDRSQMRLAAWAVIIMVGVIAGIALPGAVIFFAIGPMLALVGIAIGNRSKGLGRGLAWAGAIVQLIVFTELIAQIELTLIDGPVAATGPLVALASLPFLSETGRNASRRAIGGLGLIALGLWIAALVMPRATIERPLAFTLDHVQDENTGKAVWAAATKQAPLPRGFDQFGPWKSKPLPYNKRLRWQAAAAPIAGPVGGLTVTAIEADPKGRRVRLRLDPGGADGLLVRFDKDTPVLAMGLPGRARIIGKDADKGPSFIRCAGRTCDGLEVEILFGTRTPVAAMLVVQRFGPPREATPLLARRPRDAHPQYSPDSQVRMRVVRF